MAKAMKNTKFSEKTCMKCGKKKNLDEYYSHKDYAEGFFRDNWCKDCVKNYTKDLEAFKKYLHFNNRGFNDTLWRIAVVEAEQNLIETSKYKNADFNGKKKMEWNYQRDFYLKKMNMKNYYIFTTGNYDLEEVLKTTEQRIIEHQAQTIANEKMPELKEKAEKEWPKYKVIESDVWKGRYTLAQIERLDGYFNRLAENFDITDVHMEDMYREVAKIAIERDEAFNTYKQTKNPEDFKFYKELCDMYIRMSDAAKLSVSKRTKNDSVGFSDLGSLIKRIEESGALMRKVEFEKDDVDTVVEDFAHILRSFEGESFEEGVGNE